MPHTVESYAFLATLIVRSAMCMLLAKLLRSVNLSVWGRWAQLQQLKVCTRGW